MTATKRRTEREGATGARGQGTMAPSPSPRRRHHQRRRDENTDAGDDTARDNGGNTAAMSALTVSEYVHE